MARRFVRAAPRPPRQICPRCGTNHYAWRDSTPCRECAKELAAELEASGLSTLSNLTARRQEAVDRLEPERVDFWGDPC